MATATVAVKLLRVQSCRGTMQIDSALAFVIPTSHTMNM